MIGIKIIIAIMQYINIITVYYIFRIKSFRRSLFIKITGSMNGKAIKLIGKNVIVTPPNSSSKLFEFLSLIISILLIASIFYHTTIYLLMNIATKKLRRRIMI